MGVLDFFKRTGKAITIENLEAKTRDLDATISAKEGEIANLRADLPAKVLEGDHLAAHRIEHEERELNALRLTKAELEAKARELRASEAAAELEAQHKIAVEKARQLEQAGTDLVKLIASVGPAAEKLFALDSDFRAAVRLKAKDWEEGRFASSLMYQLEHWSPNIETPLREHIAMAFKGALGRECRNWRSVETQKPKQSGEKAA
jgi:hypothetical protein